MHEVPYYIENKFQGYHVHLLYSLYVHIYHDFSLLLVVV